MIATRTQPQEGDRRDVRAELYVKYRWYACYTHGRHEKKVNRLLEESGFESYLPLLTRERKWCDRVKKVDLPLFPSYVFARFRLIDLPRILRTSGVATIVHQNGTPAPIDDDDIANVRLLEERVRSDGIEVETDLWVEAGDSVRVTRGSLRGLKGIVILGRTREPRVLVRLQAIGRGLAVRVPRDMLARID